MRAKRVSAAFSVTESCQMWAKTGGRTDGEGRILVSTVAPACRTPIILPPLLSPILDAKSYSYTKDIKHTTGGPCGRGLGFVDTKIFFVTVLVPHTK